MAVNKPSEWANSLLARFEEQVCPLNQIIVAIQIAHVISEKSIKMGFHRFIQAFLLILAYQK